MMGTTQTSGRQQTKHPFDWREAGAYLIQYFRSPAFWAHTVLIFTSPFWMPAVIYLYFRSFIFAPSGFWAWFSIVAITVWIVYRMFVSIVISRPLHLELRAARKRSPMANAAPKSG